MNRHPKEFIENWVEDLGAEFSRAGRAYERSLDRGAPREQALKAILSKFLPKKYGIASGHVVSSAPSWSRQGDIILYNALESPVFATDDKFQGIVVPAEAVYGMIEVKSSLDETTFRDAVEKIAEFKRLSSQVSSPRLADRFGVVFAYHAPQRTARKRAACLEACIEIARTFPSTQRVDDLLLLGVESEDFSHGAYVSLMPQDSPTGALDYATIRKGRRNIKLFLLTLDARLRHVRTGPPMDLQAYLFDDNEVIVESGPDPRRLRAQGEAPVTPAVVEKIVPIIQNAHCQMCGGRTFSSYDDIYCLVASKDYYFGKMGGPHIPVVVMECLACHAINLLASNPLDITTAG